MSPIRVHSAFFCERRSSHRLLWLAVSATCALLPGRRATAQTFVQLTDLGQNIGARLTNAVARQRLGVDLFGSIGTKVSFIDNAIVYQFASDPSWGRILSGRMDYWVHEYDNRAGPVGRFRTPRGIDISARKKFYAADPGLGLVFIGSFDPA